MVDSIGSVPDPTAAEGAAALDKATPVVRIAGVDKTFLSDRARVTKALEGIDLDIRRGEFVSLIGPSGCGKSTLLRLIGDLVAPTAGRVTINDKPADRARRDRDYGIV